MSMRQSPESDRLSSDESRLKAMLIEDLENHEEGEAMLPFVMQMRNWAAPSSTPDETRQLIERLMLELPSPPRAEPLRWAWLLLRAQVRVVQAEIWTASALVMALGVLVTLTIYDVRVGGLAPLAVLAPIVVAAGVALLYDSDLEPVLELEHTTRVSSQLLLLARLTLVFGFNFALGLAGSVLLAAAKAEVQLWPLVLSWLFPMAFLSAFTFFLSIVVRDSVVGAVSGFGLWGLHVLLYTTAPPNSWLQLLSLPGLAAPESRAWLALAAILMTLAALQMVEYHRQRGSQV